MSEIKNNLQSEYFVVIVLTIAIIRIPDFISTFKLTLVEYPDLDTEPSIVQLQILQAADGFELR